MATKQSFSYREALAEVEKILAKLEANELDIDEMSEAVKRAHLLLEQCRQKLHSVDDDVNKTFAEGE